MLLHTLPNMERKAPLKICKTNIEQMTEREQLDMIEPAIRGGVTSVCEERHFLANNKYLSGYRPSEESLFAFCVDANNIYGVVNQMDQQPVGEYAFILEITVNDILNSSKDSPIGYFVEWD